jgi:hypothetical protein
MAASNGYTSCIGYLQWRRVVGVKTSPIDFVSKTPTCLAHTGVGETFSASKR